MQNITKLRLVMQLPENVTIGSSLASGYGPFLQGVLMEQIDSSYASFLHSQPFNPYSIYCELDKQYQTLNWNISTLTTEASEQIINPVVKLDEVCLRGTNEVLPIIEKTVSTITTKEITDLINTAKNKKIKVRFVTPTAFKSGGEYVIMPTVRLIFQNLLMHYTQVYESGHEVDSETLAYIEKNVRITSYELRTQYFSHATDGGRRTPAFVGTIALSFRGPYMLVGLANMLLKFGEYAGIGIKTSMGMGGMQCL